MSFLHSVVYFSDEDVEEQFDLSVSKLRTAQRLGLVEAAQASRTRRQIRLWSAESVLRVWIVEVMVRYTGIPFNVAAGMFAAGPLERWRAVCAATFDEGPEDACPKISIINRKTVAAEYPGPEFVIAGTIEIDRNGRSYFQKDRKPFNGDFCSLAAPDFPISYILYDVLGAVRSFRDLYAQARPFPRDD